MTESEDVEGKYFEDLEEILKAENTKKRETKDRYGYNAYTHSFEKLELTPKQKLVLALTGKVKLEDREYSGWTGKLPFYAYKCKTDIGNVLLINYPRHYSETLDNYVVKKIN